MKGNVILTMHELEKILSNYYFGELSNHMGQKIKVQLYNYDSNNHTFTFNIQRGE